MAYSQLLRLAGQPDIPTPPIPSDPNTAARWEHTALRERLLRGLWRSDLIRALEQHMGRTRAQGQGYPDQSSNLLKSLAVQLSVLYDRPPSVSHPSGQAGELVDDRGILASAGLWPLQRQTQRYAVGMNEALVAVDIVAGRPLYRVVAPNYVEATPDPDNPSQPLALREARLRRRPDTGRLVWTWDEWRPAERLFQVSLARAGDDDVEATALFVTTDDGQPVEGPLVGDDYPAVNGNGDALLPYVLYHLNRTSDLFNAFEGIEVVEGTLNAAVGWSFFFHCLRDASWPTRYAAGVVPLGTAVDARSGGEGRQTVATDPATVLLLEVLNEDGGAQPIIGQWSAASDPSMIADCMAKFEARVAEFAGISPADIQRLSAQARSGYAISISNHGKREAQRRMSPQFQDADEQLVGLTAALLNGAPSYDGAELPEGGYEVRYEDLPMSPQELDAIRRHVLELLDAGLIDRVTALQKLSPGLSRVQAEERLREIQRANTLTAPL